jgi:Mn-containing catalase
MTREITNMKAFGIALETMDKGPLEIGDMPVEDEGVNTFFNDSTGQGEIGEDATGPWNQGNV